MYASDASARSANGWSAQKRDLLRHPADTDAHGQPALREHVDGGQHLGGQHGMAVRQHEHRGEKANAAGGGGDEAQRRHLLEGDARVLGEELARLGIGVGAFDLGRDNDVVAHAEVLVSERLRLLRNGPQRVGITGDPARTEMQSEFHWFLHACCAVSCLGACEDMGQLYIKQGQPRAGGNATVRVRCNGGCTFPERYRDLTAGHRAVCLLD